MTPIYNTSEANPHIVPDYPYGRLRCQIRFWVEYSPNKGFRLVSQTQNPKTNQWNSPKKGTYHRLAGCLYTDDKGHTHMAACSEYSSFTDVLDYLRNFPEDKVSWDILQAWSLAKVAYYRKLVAETMRMVITVNGVEQEQSEEQREAETNRNRESLAGWEKVLEVLK